MHKLGPPVRLECGIRLGNVSRMKAYEVDWQRVRSPETIKIISSCMSHSNLEEDTADSKQNSCKPGFDFNDLSLTPIDAVEPDTSGQALFKCVVKLDFQPSSSPFAPKIQAVDTRITFYGKCNKTQFGELKIVCVHPTNKTCWCFGYSFSTWESYKISLFAYKLGHWQHPTPSLLSLQNQLQSPLPYLLTLSLTLERI